MCTAVSTKVVPQKRTRQCRLVLWVERVYRWLIKVHGFYQQEKRRHKYICLLFRFMSSKHLKPESRTMNPHYPKHLLALSSTVLLDNLSQNSCMNKNSNNIVWLDSVIMLVLPAIRVQPLLAFCSRASCKVPPKSLEAAPYWRNQSTYCAWSKTY